LLYKEIPK